MKKYLSLTLLLMSSLLLFSQEKKEYDTDHYRERVASFQVNPIGANKIVFIGDSMIEAGKWSEYFSNTDIVNRGSSGDNTEGMLNRFAEIVEAKPRILFMSGGVNDISQNVKVKDIVTNLRSMIHLIKEQSPATVIYLQGALPINNDFGQYKRLIKKEKGIIKLNKQLKKLAAKEKITFIYTYPLFLDANGKQLKAEYTRDGLHLTQDAYGIWVEAIRKYIE